MSDKTTAPKRIYLDIGDQEALDRVRSGDLPWESLREVTWSEDNASGFGVAYVREDQASRALRRLSEIGASLGTPWPDDKSDEESIRRLAWFTRMFHLDPQTLHDSQCRAAFLAFGGTDMEHVAWGNAEQARWSKVVHAVLNFGAREGAGA